MEEQFKFIKKHAQEGFYCYAGDNPPGLKGGQANEDVLTLLQALREAEEQRDQALDQVAGLAEFAKWLQSQIKFETPSSPSRLTDFGKGSFYALQKCWDELVSRTGPLSAQTHAARLREEGAAEAQEELEMWRKEWRDAQEGSDIIFNTPADMRAFQEMLKADPATDAAEGGPDA